MSLRVAARPTPTLLVLIGLFLFGLLPTTQAVAADGPQNFPNAGIADAGLRYVGQARPTGWDQPGECIKWVQSWVREAGGRMAGGGPVSAYTGSPAIEVSIGEATRGDVFQIAKGDTYDGSPHTGVVLGSRNGDGTFDIVEGNVPAGSGRVRTSRRVLSAPAGHQLRFWRFGKPSPVGPVNTKPIGSVDAAVGAAPGRILVRGWTFDPDTPATANSVHVYVGGPAGSGAGMSAIPADHRRPDVAAVHGQAGPNHGFDAEIGGIGPGRHAVYVYAIDTTGNNNPQLWSGTVDVPATAPGTPDGHFDDAIGRVGRKAVVRGWAFDPDAPTQPVDVHAYIDGWAGSGARAVNLGTAALDRSDVAAARPGAGPSHGFDKVIDGLEPGLHTIYLYAINRAGSGDNPLLGVRTVHIIGPDPIGSVDLIQGSANGLLEIVGWTFDPDTPETPTTLHVYFGAPPGQPGARVAEVGAQIRRDDLPAAFPGVSANHGFSAAIGGLAPGGNQVWVYAINTATGGNNPLLWSGTVTAPPVAAGTPIGSLDAADGTRGGKARLRGWAFDPNSLRAPLGMHVYVDGPAGSGARGINAGLANRTRPDVGQMHPAAGDDHGYDLTIDGLSPGRHTLWVYAIDAVPPGINPLLGAITVTVPEGQDPALAPGSAAPQPAAVTPQPGVSAPLTVSGSFPTPTPKPLPPGASASASAAPSTVSPQVQVAGTRTKSSSRTIDRTVLLSHADCATSRVSVRGTGVSVEKARRLGRGRCRLTLKVKLGERGRRSVEVKRGGRKIRTKRTISL